MENLENTTVFKFIFLASVAVIILLVRYGIYYNMKLNKKITSLTTDDIITLLFDGQEVTVKVVTIVESQKLITYNVVGDKTFKTFNYYYGDKKYVSDLTK